MKILRDDKSFFKKKAKTQEVQRMNGFQKMTYKRYKNDKTDERFSNQFFGGQNTLPFQCVMRDALKSF